MGLFDFVNNVSAEIYFDDELNRKSATKVFDDGNREKVPIYYDGETVSGKIVIIPGVSGSNFKHNGIKVHFFGQIEALCYRNSCYHFISKQTTLSESDVLNGRTEYSFQFENVNKPYESYAGFNVRLRYFVRIVINKTWNNYINERDIIVHSLSTYPEKAKIVSAEVGLENILQLEYEYDNFRYSLNETIVGAIHFQLVLMKVIRMELQLVLRETTGYGNATNTETSVINSIEIMDGAPNKGESIPFRMRLSTIKNISITQEEVCELFSVNFFLNIQMEDDKGRTFYKQQEIKLYRGSREIYAPIMDLTLSEQPCSSVHQKVSAVQASEESLNEYKDSNRNESTSNYTDSNDILNQIENCSINEDDIRESVVE
ncbi:Vacuolar protein sorting-associated protein 26 [Intoshia linei]|uniref:Vacuolar protein sorting-associated protein 26 n=1 Tax=Intoshia linei TaxID=1819745 RepID=A0A177AWJ3_9BILA|nr:Vacuolar protein sorting-associated protein 26 [Intoshia linei]